MKFTNLQKKPADELKKDEFRLEVDMLRLRGQITTGGAGKDAGKIRAMKREYAQIQTLKNKPKTKKKEVTGKR